MPRRPIRHCGSLKPWPLTSSFSRSVAQLASSYTAKRQMHDSKIHRESPRKSADNGYLKHTLEGKSEQSVSSDEEEFEDHKCIMDLKDFLLKACQDKDVVDKLRSLVGEQAQNVDILVSQHVVNLPPQLLQPLYDALFDEVSWATEDEPTEELRNSFYFKFYIVVSKIYKHKNADKKMRNDSDEAIIYAKPEDEVFHRLSLCPSAFLCRLDSLQLMSLGVISLWD